MAPNHSAGSPALSGDDLLRRRAANLPVPLADAAGQARRAGYSDGMRTPADEADMMAVFGVRRSGRFYLCRGYRYTRIGDAIAYARRACAHPELARQEPPADTGSDGSCCAEAESTSVRDASLMAQWKITFSQGQYGYGGFRYDHLRDAAAYARLELSM